MSGVCSLLQIKQRQSTAYHHESIGALENSHKVLGAYLRSYSNQHKLDWDRWLPYFVFCWNTTVHESTGYTPFEFVYGRKCTLPSNLKTELRRVDPCYNFENYANELRYRLQVASKDAYKTLIDGKIQRKDKYDREARIKEFGAGTLVVVKKENRSKLDQIYVGPFEVIREEGANCVIKISNEQTRIVHKNRLKKYYDITSEECRIII